MEMYMEVYMDMISVYMYTECTWFTAKVLLFIISA